MIKIEIPGREQPLVIDALVLDYNGTIACDGDLIEGVPEKIRELCSNLPVYILTADTYGTVKRQCAGLGAEILTFPHAAAGACKEEIVRKLSNDQSVCVIGNGFNDVQMFDLAALSVAVLDTEGMYAGLLAHADVMVRAAPDALDLLLKPNRLRATLRN
jgi:P-type E1-E2 ATPase